MRLLRFRHGDRIAHGIVPTGEDVIRVLSGTFFLDPAPTGEELPLEGPVAIVESISPERIRWSKHVVHVVFAAGLTGSLADVASRDAAVDGHRVVRLDELGDVQLHPPIGRFLQRWQPGDPCVYLGSVWAR